MGGRGASSSIGTKLASANNKTKTIPIDISTIQEQTLQQIENRIRKLKHEEAFIFDENDNLVAGVSGGNSSVGIPQQWFGMDGATVTHGHPSGKADFGGTLSFADMDVMTDTKWKEMRAAANGQGEFNYIVRRTAKSDNSGLKAKIVKDSSKMESKINLEYKKAYSKAIAEGKSKQSARHEGWQKATGIAQAYWRKTLPKYGFEFVTPKKGYNYNGR